MNTKNLTEDEILQRQEAVSAELDQARTERDDAALEAATTGEKAAKDRLQKAQVRMNNARLELDALGGALKSAKRQAEEADERERARQQEEEFQELEDNIRQLLDHAPHIAEARRQLRRCLDASGAFDEFVAGINADAMAALGLGRGAMEPLPGWKLTQLVRELGDSTTNEQGMAGLVEIINDALTQLAHARGKKPQLVAIQQSKEAA